MQASKMQAIKIQNPQRYNMPEIQKQDQRETYPLGLVQQLITEHWLA